MTRLGLEKFSLAVFVSKSAVAALRKWAS